MLLNQMEYLPFSVRDPLGYDNVVVEDDQARYEVGPLNEFSQSATFE